jgi:hypothetical protein
MNMGYEPWRAHAGVNLWDHHQACVRLLRADYCGDGVSYTRNGTPINIYDSLGINPDTEAWAFEASWGRDGARCVSGSWRQPDLGSTISCPLHYPKTNGKRGRIDETCEEPYFNSHNLLLVTEVLQ